jgi:hypothetical protein
MAFGTKRSMGKWMASTASVLALGVGVGALGLAVPGAAPLAHAAPTKGAPAKDEPLKANPKLKAAIDKRIAPFTLGIDKSKVFALLDAQIDEKFAPRMNAEKYSPKQIDQAEKERDKKKKQLRESVVEFKGGAGVSGYESKAPGEFTYRNNESAVEVPRPGGGERLLFFINDRLWKIFDAVPLTGKDSELGETWESAVDKVNAVIGDKGKLYAPKATLPSWFGTLISTPELLLWSDGTTQVRLVNWTKREDFPTRTVALVYEEVVTLDKLPSYRSHVEAKASDAAVDKAGADKVDPTPKKTKK